MLTIVAVIGPVLPAAVTSAGPAPKPTIVLVHGAWADAASWAPVTRRLQDAGYTVLATPNPLRGLSSDAAYPGAPSGDVDLYIKQTVFPQVFAADLPTPASHLSMLSRPDTVTHLITAAARATN